MKKIPVILAATLLAAPILAFAQNPPQAVTVVEKAPGAGAVAEAVQLQGKVKSIDKKARTVVVAGATGNEVQFVLSEAVRNFDQIKVGDLVTLSYSQALAIELKAVANNGIRERIDTEKSAVAKPGEKPGMMGEKSVRVIANVVAINPKAQTVTLRGPKRTLELYVKDPAMLQNVKVGDQVEGVYTEAMALTVTADPKKKK